MEKTIRVQRYKYTNFLSTDYARALKFMFIRRELGGTGTGCLFQFTYCDVGSALLKSIILIQSLISRINEVYIAIFYWKKSYKLHLSRLFCFNHTCYCVNIVSVTSASRYHPRYQSRSSMYIRGMIPRNFAENAEAVPIVSRWQADRKKQLNFCAWLQVLCLSTSTNRTASVPPDTLKMET